jgi:hypothetical protein
VASLDDILAGKYGTVENPAPGSFLAEICDYGDHTLVDWASQDEIDERFRSETAPLVYCDQLEQDKRRMSKLLGLLHAHAWILSSDLMQATKRTYYLFQKRT